MKPGRRWEKAKRDGAKGGVNGRVRMGREWGWGLLEEKEYQSQGSSERIKKNDTSSSPPHSMQGRTNSSFLSYDLWNDHFFIWWLLPATPTVGCCCRIGLRHFVWESTLTPDTAIPSELFSRMGKSIIYITYFPFTISTGIDSNHSLYAMPVYVFRLQEEYQK